MGRSQMGAPLASHSCPVRAAAGGLIESAWCLDTMAPVIRGLPGWLTEETVTRPELLVHRAGAVEVYYTPFDSVNAGAQIVLIGICPGRHQMLLAVREARRVFLEGGTVAQTLTAADATASFAGPMRRNLVRMLDGIGVQDALGIASAASLFGEHQNLADSQSMCNFTVQVRSENYRGASPRIDQVPFLRAYATQVLAAALEMSPDALVVPLGKAVSGAVTMLLVREDRLDPRRCLLGAAGRWTRPGTRRWRPVPPAGRPWPQRGASAARRDGAGAPARRVDVRGQQAPAGLGSPGTSRERRLPLPGGDVVDRERTGDDVKRRIGQVQVLGGAYGEGDGGECVPPPAGDRHVGRQPGR